MFGILILLILFGFLAAFVARCYESGTFRQYAAEVRRVWRSWGVPLQAIMAALLVFCAIDGRTKGSNPLTAVYRMLFWDGAPWALQESVTATSAAVSNNVSASSSIAAATNTIAATTAYVASNSVFTFSFDWGAPDRLPYHAAQNVLGRTVWVQPTNINGTLFEDHYVSFNAAASTNPAVILIEYATRNSTGGVDRTSSPTVTNSYPLMYPVTVQSGTHTCYWFRCAVPIAYTNSVRDWNGEALFGSPEGSGKGFDLLGTLVVDDGDNVWVGATTNMVIGSITNAVKNGIILEN